MSTFPLACLRLLVPLLLICGAVAEEKAKDGVTPYPLDFCATCKDEEGHAGEELVTRVHKDREIKLCRGCIRIFTADPDGYVKKVDKVIKEHAAKDPKKDAKDAEKAADKGHEGHEHKDGEHKDHDHK
ncbi:MAG TPA: hypothetical protein VEL07_19510 [Planctomycetota bacterium]|nr:hypothetical protein [Planctomycetota bacterium]